MPNLKRLTLAPARIDTEEGRVRLYLPATANASISLAQFNDYQGNKESRAPFANQAPLHITLKAALSPASAVGSFGFGLWNEPEANAEAQPTVRPLASEACLFLYNRSEESAPLPLWQAVTWQDGKRTESTDLAKLPPTDWHTYEIDWKAGGLSFIVDGVACLRVAAPTGPLGFVIWMSNQAFIFSPQGQIALEPCAIEQTQWLEVSAIKVE